MSFYLYLTTTSEAGKFLARDSLMHSSFFKLKAVLLNDKDTGSLGMSPLTLGVSYPLTPPSGMLDRLDLFDLFEG